MKYKVRRSQKNSNSQGKLRPLTPRNSVAEFSRDCRPLGNGENNIRRQRNAGRIIWILSRPWWKFSSNFLYIWGATSAPLPPYCPQVGPSSSGFSSKQLLVCSFCTLRGGNRVLFSSFFFTSRMAIIFTFCNALFPRTNFFSRKKLVSNSKLKILYSILLSFLCDQTNCGFF